MSNKLDEIARLQNLINFMKMKAFMEESKSSNVPCEKCKGKIDSCFGQEKTIRICYKCSIQGVVDYYDQKLGLKEKESGR